MKKNNIKAAAFAVVCAIALLPFFPKASALTENGFTHLLTSNSPYCHADITIEGDHFTIDGRAVQDPVVKISFSNNSVIMSDYLFISGEDNTYHAEFDCTFSGSSCNLWFVQESGLVMAYLMQHDEKGWSFPDNGLNVLNAEKLENIQTAAPEASAFYLSQTADPVEIEETLTELEGLVQEICGEEQDDYEKAYLIFRWIAENIYYDSDAAETGVTLDTVAVHNVLERRRTTCAGFSNTYCAMLEIAGIRSVNLKGAAVAGGVTYDELPTVGENHEFTAFWYGAESRWVYADPTWGSNGKYKDGKYNYDSPAVDKYFDETGEAFSLRHRADRAEERAYTAALDPVEETEETTKQPTEAVETDPTQGTDTEPDKSTETDRTDRTTDAPADQNKPNRSTALYIVIGAAGVIIAVTGIILIIKKKS